MTPTYEVFISYAQKDGEIAASLATRLHDAGIKCFLADRSILAAAEWEPTLRDAMRSSQRVLLLMTPRSKSSLWVAAEAGAAWALQKDLIPVLMFVEANELFEPIRKFQARIAETPYQLDTLVGELSSICGGVRVKPAELPNQLQELFNTPNNWDRLVKVGQWTFEPVSGAIVGEGMYRYLLSDQTYGINSFRISASLTFLALWPEGGTEAVNAGIVLGWHTPLERPKYLHLMFSGTRLLLEEIGRSGADEYTDYLHIDEGVPFILQAQRTYDICVGVDQDNIGVSIDSRRVYSVRAPRQAVIGKVGLRPWRSLLRCERFEIVSTGELQP